MGVTKASIITGLIVGAVVWYFTSDYYKKELAKIA